MTTRPDFTISPGFADAERGTVAAHYWNAFNEKLGKAPGPRSRALGFLSQVLNPEFALNARGAKGVTGFKTGKGAMVDGGLRDLARHYGWLGTAWHAPLLSIVERTLTEDTLLMDGICVSAPARGMGLGTPLLNAIKAEVAAWGLKKVRRDVISTNPRARALYEREGFDALATETLGPFRHIFCFESSTKMPFPA